MGAEGHHGQFGSSLPHPPRSPLVLPGTRCPRRSLRSHVLESGTSWRGSHVNQPDKAREGVGRTDGTFCLLPTTAAPPHGGESWLVRRSCTCEGQGSARGDLGGLHENHLCPLPHLHSCHPQSGFSDALAGHFPASIPLHKQFLWPGMPFPSFPVYAHRGTPSVPGTHRLPSVFHIRFSFPTTFWFSSHSLHAKLSPSHISFN